MRQPAEVFAYATDPSELATWQTNTVSARQEGDGAVGLGTRIREVHRMPGGREAESLVEVSEYEPDRTFALRVVEGTPIHARLTFEPSDGGTLMRFRAHGRIGGRATRLVELLLRVVLRRQFARHCETLKRRLESGPQTA
jgi:uncharacterized protein YndB with AHSA1/START domain